MATNTLPPAPEWAADFCRDYVGFLFSAGKWTLIAGVLLGILLAISVVVAAFRKPPVQPAADGGAQDAATPMQLLEAMKAFLQALSSAPTWLALFGGGILLLWLAGAMTPEICKPADRPAPARTESGRQQQPQTPAGNSQAPAGNPGTNAQDN